MHLKAFAIIIAVLAIAASGCVLQPTPVPPVSPAPVASSTPAPTVWPPATIGTIESSQVSVTGVNVTYNRGAETMQSENYSILLENSGGDPANNTLLTLRESDTHTGQEYYNSSRVNVGDLAPHSSKLVNISSDRHDYGYSVLVQVDCFWGDSLEFHNTFQKTYVLMQVDTNEL